MARAARRKGKTTGPDWFSVRCVLRVPPHKRWGQHDLPPGENAYEERITLWRVGSAEEAIERAEAEARDYAETVEMEYTGLAQSYWLPDKPGDGAEVFSLFRTSGLAPKEYLDTFFDTGSEHQTIYTPHHP